MFSLFVMPSCYLTFIVDTHLRYRKVLLDTYNQMFLDIEGLDPLQRNLLCDIRSAAPTGMMIAKYGVESEELDVTLPVQQTTQVRMLKLMVDYLFYPKHITAECTARRILNILKPVI